MFIKVKRFVACCISKLKCLTYFGSSNSKFLNVKDSSFVPSYMLQIYCQTLLFKLKIVGVTLTTLLAKPFFAEVTKHSVTVTPFFFCRPIVVSQKHVLPPCL